LRAQHGGERSPDPEVVWPVAGNGPATVLDMATRGDLHREIDSLDDAQLP